jgi:hypothetical protein
MPAERRFTSLPETLHTNKVSEVTETLRLLVETALAL